MWQSVITSVVGGAVLAFLAQQIAKGGRRWRALTVAKHELEVAGHVNDDAELRSRLEASAHARLERYLRRPDPRWQSRRRRLGEAVLIFGLVGGAVVAVGAAFDSPAWWTAIGGVVVGLAVQVNDERVKRKLASAAVLPHPKARAE